MSKRPHIECYQPLRAYQPEYDVVLAYTSSQLPLSGVALKSSKLIQGAFKYLRPSGLLFIYAPPETAPYHAIQVEESDVGKEFVFKYWIGIRTIPQRHINELAKCQKGLLLYASKQKFALNKVRVPHSYCESCGANLRDWGGKKHLMHPAGVALSDIWKDLLVPWEQEIPQVLLERIVELSPEQNPNILLIRLPAEVPPQPNPMMTKPSSIDVEANKVVLGDCLEVMKSLPDGSVDLAFADPPYNLDKNYFSYDDARHDQEYLAWCEQWLYEYQRILSPTGSLFLVNLPKWSIHHKVFLDKYLYFQDWIVWDALSEPRGKLMPAHYSILYYTKHPTRRVFNEERSYQLSPNFCLRASCIKKRQREGINDHIALSNIWWDVPRIRHKRYRDVHPCQLPEKLMERIISLASKPGDIVFDAFCGTGTTAIVAKQLGRRYLVGDIDEYYVNLTLQKLELLDKWGTIPKASVAKKKSSVTKKQLQLELLRLADQLGRLPREEDVHSYSIYPLSAYLEAFPSFGKALRAAKVHKEFTRIH